MLHAALRRSGGSFIMTVPQSYVEQNRLAAGSTLALDIVGEALTIRPERPKRSLAELLAATPRGPQRAKGWDAMGRAGAEL